MLSGNTITTNNVTTETSFMPSLLDWERRLRSMKAMRIFWAAVKVAPVRARRYTITVIVATTTTTIIIKAIFDP